MQPPGTVDHVVAVVEVGEAGAEEDAAQVDVVGDVASFHVPDGHAAVAFQDLHRHRGLLLADADERLEALLQLVRTG